MVNGTSPARVGSSYGRTGLADLIAETGGAQGRDRQAAGGDHQGFAASPRPAWCPAGSRSSSFSMVWIEVSRCRLHAGLVGTRRAAFRGCRWICYRRTTGRAFFSWYGTPCLADHADEVPLGVARQRRFAEVRVLRKEVARLGVHVGEIAAAAAGHQDLLAGLVRVVEQHHLAPAPGGGQRAHQACGASANDHNFGRAQNGVLIQITERLVVGAPARDGSVTDNADTWLRVAQLAAGSP